MHDARFQIDIIIVMAFFAFFAFLAPQHNFSISQPNPTNMIDSVGHVKKSTASNTVVCDRQIANFIQRIYLVGVQQKGQ